MVNEAFKQFIAEAGGNKTVIASKLGDVVTPNMLGMIERGKRKPNAELVQRIRDVYNFDVLTGRTTVQEEEQEYFRLPREAWDELKKNNSSFTSVITSFNKALDVMREDKVQLYSIIDKLIMDRRTSERQTT
jgi:transcriptional regulator with XRE-family HTH domain